MNAKASWSHGTAFHVTWCRPSPFSAKSKSPLWHSGHKSVTTASLSRIPIDEDVTLMQVPHAAPPYHCLEFIATRRAPAGTVLPFVRQSSQAPRESPFAPKYVPSP